MFAILQISDKNAIFRKPEIKSQRFTLPSGDAFFVVTTDKYMGKIPWKKLEKCLGILRSRILPPDNIIIPHGINIETFNPKIFPHILLMNSFLDYIEKNKLCFTNKSLTIFDEEKTYENYIEKIIPYLKHIKIISDQPETYKALSEKLMINYGFSLLATSKVTFDCDIVLSHKFNVPLYFNGTLFTNEKRYLMNADVFSGSGIELPSEYESLKPSNIDRLLFASALYEKCDEKVLGKLRYTYFGC